MSMTATTALRSFAAATLLAAAALPSQAAGYTYSLAAGSLISGGSLAGSFSGADGDSDGYLSLAELASFSVSYTGLPNVTSSFTITQSPDDFSYDLADNQLVFSVTDASSNSVSVNTYDGGSYSVLSATGPDAGSGSLAISAVPEPSQWALVGGGLLLLAAARARRTAASVRSS